MATRGPEGWRGANASVTLKVWSLLHRGALWLCTQYPTVYLPPSALSLNQLSRFLWLFFYLNKSVPKWSPTRKTSDELRSLGFIFLSYI